MEACLDMHKVNDLMGNDRITMWANDIVFCPQMGELTTAAIANLMSQQVFSANADFTALLKERYEKMAANFQIEPHESRKWEQRIRNHVCQAVYDGGKPDARLAVPTQYIGSSDNRIKSLRNARNLGVDMPVWLSQRGAHKDAPRIMLVAQDPLRDGDSNGNLYISSPWAFHCRDFRHKTRMRIPFLLVSYLLGHGNCLYLTDAFKIFAEDHKYSDEIIRPDFRQPFQDVLRAEIELFVPDVIVAIGEQASCAVMAVGERNEEIGNWANVVIPRPSLKSVTMSGRVIPCVLASHFSRISAYQARLKAEVDYCFSDGAGNENYIQYYVQAISRIFGKRNHRGESHYE